MFFKYFPSLILLPTVGIFAGCSGSSSSSESADGPSDDTLSGTVEVALTVDQTDPDRPILRGTFHHHDESHQHGENHHHAVLSASAADDTDDQAWSFELELIENPYTTGPNPGFEGKWKGVAHPPAGMPAPIATASILGMQQILRIVPTHGDGQTPEDEDVVIEFHVHAMMVDGGIGVHGHFGHSEWSQTIAGYDMTDFTATAPHPSPAYDAEHDRPLSQPVGFYNLLSDPAATWDDTASSLTFTIDLAREFGDVDGHGHNHDHEHVSIAGVVTQ